MIAFGRGGRSRRLERDCLSICVRLSDSLFFSGKVGHSHTTTGTISLQVVPNVRTKNKRRFDVGLVGSGGVCVELWVIFTKNPRKVREGVGVTGPYVHSELSFHSGVCLQKVREELVDFPRSCAGHLDRLSDFSGCVFFSKSTSKKYCILHFFKTP